MVEAVAGLGDVIIIDNYMHLRSKPAHNPLPSVMSPWPMNIVSGAAQARPGRSPNRLLLSLGRGTSAQAAAVVRDPDIAVLKLGRRGAAKAARRIRSAQGQSAAESGGSRSK